MGHLFTELMRRLFALLDGIVAWAIELLYVLLIKIADTDVLGDLIYHYLGRIYTFLGIFMVFKLSLSIINYIVNPDALTDKSKGFSKLITNVVISLVLLAITPNLFDAAFNLQSDLLGQNVIYQIVTGKKLTSGGTLEENAKAQGKSMSYAVFSSFIYPSNLSRDSSNISVSDIHVGNCESSDGADCLLKPSIIVKEDDDDDFVYEYKYLLSTICGCAVVYMLFTFCFQAALRAVKLSFLRIIAPIPILSMIDPKTGTSKLSTWGKECLNTFLDLFIRLAAIFFALDIIHNVIEGSDGVMITFSTGQTVTNLFVRLFIIIGCLMFAKQMPSLIESLFGIKLSGGGFSLKKMVGSAVGGTALLAGGAMLGRAAVGATRLGANTVNAGARLGLSTLKNKLTGKDNSASVDRFRQRMNYAGQEAKGRFTSLNKKYTGDKAGKLYKKNVSAEKEAAKQFDKGNKLWEEVQKSGDEYSIYSNPSFRDSAKLMNDAKSRRNKATEAYDLAQIQFQRGEISQDEFSKIRLASIDAQSDFDKAKAEFDEQSKIYTSDAEKYKLYSATADRIKVERNVHSNNNMGSVSSSTSNSNPTVEVMRATKDTTYNTPQGKRVEVKQGEKVTKSGIIIGNDSNFNKR